MFILTLSKIGLSNVEISRTLGVSRTIAIGKEKKWGVSNHPRCGRLTLIQEMK